jgi:hypothetical protein
MANDAESQVSCSHNIVQSIHQVCSIFSSPYPSVIYQLTKCNMYVSNEYQVYPCDSGSSRTSKDNATPDLLKRGYDDESDEQDA